MSKKVIVCEAGKRVYETLEEASEVLGVSPSTISRAIERTGEVNGVRARWADRVYIVKLKRGEWHVAMLNQGGGAYILLNDGSKIKKAAVAEVKDITVAWYFSKEKW